ncbi:Choline transport protein [Colletotrichum gloeosporioides]|uniref:Choline transport protein n=1 Tax=Colletotrichum gloeosporioides TaxID=474922 RepID=A0A8H4CJT3_COLGL|nr:Choline transport protein [Colletotrichum gloeosporioides]KAF3805166.1 Choline transport protein [Colletotrichum gloeosporioides]
MMNHAIYADAVPHADPAAIAANKCFAKDAASNEPLHRLSISHGTLEPYANIDDAILRANGHDQVLKRQFSWVSALGLSFSITNSWIGYLFPLKSNFGQNLIYGGPQSCIFGLLVAFAAQLVITLGLGEIASAFPSTGGQYHFCYILSSPNTRRFAGYLIGWMSMLAWWIVTVLRCSGISLFSMTLAGMIQFWHPGFEGTQWQIYLIYVGTATVTVLPVISASQKITFIVQLSLYSSVLGFLVLLFVAIALHKQSQPASFLTQSGLGSRRWPAGIAWTLGIANAMYAFGGTDDVIHISEEMPHPGRRVPQVMMLTMIIGLATAFPLFLSLMFYMKDFAAVISSRLPSLELINQVVRTGNDKVTLPLFAYILFVYLVCLPSQWVTSGRLAWAFARDRGVPFSSYFANVDSKRHLPIRTTVASYVFACLYGLLYLVSTSAFNSIVTSAVLFLNITYAAPQAILLFRGRQRCLPRRYFNLGWAGYVCNILSILWILVLLVFICMPPSLPATPASMNYTAVVLVGLLFVVVSLWYMDRNKTFQGPEIDWDMIRSLNSSRAGAANDAR